jgi:hypothetical protein
MVTISLARAESSCGTLRCSDAWCPTRAKQIHHCGVAVRALAESSRCTSHPHRAAWMERSEIQDWAACSTIPDCAARALHPDYE